MQIKSSNMGAGFKVVTSPTLGIQQSSGLLPPHGSCLLCHLCMDIPPSIYLSVHIRALGLYLSSIQSLSRVRLFETPWTAARQASLSITNSRRLLNLMSIESVMPANYLILCHPLLFLPSIIPSIRVFSHKSALHIMWPKHWSFSSSISPSNEHPGLISFRMDWLDLLAVLGTLKSLLQHHSSKASILQCSAFFMAQLSLFMAQHDHWKNHSLD